MALTGFFKRKYMAVLLGPKKLAVRLVFPSSKVNCKGAEGYVSVRFCLLAEVQTGKYNVPNYFITLPFNQETLITVGTFYRCRWLFKL